MSEGLDQKIRSAVTELVETSPPPHPAERALKSHTAERRPLSLRAGLARMAVAALAVLLIGLVGVWIGRSTAPPDAANTSDVLIVEGTLGPEPEFDPATEFGAVEKPLGPPSGELAPEVSTDTESAVGAREGDFKAVGGIPGTELEVFRWETERNQTCKQVVGEDVRSTGCVDELTYGSDPYNPDGNSLGTFDMTDRSFDGTVVVWGVSEETAAVLVDTGDEVIWQRPRAAMVAFAFDADISTVTLVAYDANQAPLADTEFSPPAPGETQVTGSLELGDPDPGPIVDAQWVPEDVVPPAADMPETPPALGPSSVPKVIHTETDAVYLVVWGNNCRPNVTVEGRILPSEFMVVVSVEWDRSDSCSGAVNEWFARVDVHDSVDTSVARVAFTDIGPLPRSDS